MDEPSQLVEKGHAHENERPTPTHRLLGIVLATAVLALAGEVLLRTFPQLCPVQQQVKIASSVGGVPFVDDPELGARLEPLAHEQVRTLDYEYVATTDSLGFPNSMPWPTRPAIVVLGNSLITGAGVGLEGQFSTLLAQKLGGRSVLNLGLPGGSPVQELSLYDRYARARRPDVVVASLWVASDVSSTIELESWLAEDSPPDFTRYRQTFGTTHGGIELLNRARDLLSGSYLLRALYYGTSALLDDGGPAGRVRLANGDEMFLSIRSQHRLAGGAQRSGVDFAEAFVAPLVRLRAEAAADGARFVIVLLPSKEEIYGAPSFPAVLETVDDVRAALRANGLPVLDLYGTFAERGGSRAPFYKRDIHFNGYGNEIVAEALASWVREGTCAPPSGSSCQSVETDRAWQQPRLPEPRVH